MKLIPTLLLTFLFNACALAEDIEDQRNALFHYQQAIKAFGDGEISKTKELISQALQYKSTDGFVIDQPKLRFKKNLAGRGRKSLPIIEGNKVAYLPNDLLHQVELKEQELLAYEHKLHKQKFPPKLTVKALSFFDEDGNGIASPLESIHVQFEVQNEGKTTATELVITFKIAGVERITKVFNVATLTPDENQQFEYNFQINSEEAQRNSKLMLQLFAKEIDNGEELIFQSQYKLRKTFSPVLQISPIYNKQDILLLKRNHQLCYEIKNKGKETAYNLSLNVVFDYADKVNLVKNIDLRDIDILRVGDQRNICFSVAAQRLSTVQGDLGVNVSYQYRGVQTRLYKLGLSCLVKAEGDPQIANIAELIFPKIIENKVEKSVNKSAVLLHLDHANSRLDKKYKTNFKVAIEKNLAIEKPLLIESDFFETYYSYDDSFNQVNELITSGVDTLHIFINLIGGYDQITQQAYFISPNDIDNQKIYLQQWLNRLERLPFNTINIFIETQFKGEFEQYIPLVVSQPIFDKLPPNINIFSASQPLQNNSYLPNNNGYLFSLLVLAGISGHADMNSDSFLSYHELADFLKRNTLKFSSKISSNIQVPLISISQNHSFIQYKKGNSL